MVTFIFLGIPLNDIHLNDIHPDLIIDDEEAGKAFLICWLREGRLNC
jgi:hypothetical protein